MVATPASGPRLASHSWQSASDARSNDGDGLDFAGEFLRHFRLFGLRLSRGTKYPRRGPLTRAVSALNERDSIDEAKIALATGECRPSDSQKPYADLGMVVSKNHRGQGLATNILRQLIRRCRENGLSPICSTERDNYAAQKAIENSGFVSHHRLLEIAF